MIKFNKLINFGPIGSIDKPVSFKNLTIFMGDNSSGKSYLAMLTHSFCAMTKGYDNPDFLKAVRNKFSDTGIIKELKSILESFNENDEFSLEIILTKEESSEIKEIIKFATNDYLINKYLLPRVLSSDTQIGEIDIEIENIDKYLIRTISLSKKTNGNSIEIMMKFDEAPIFNYRFLGISGKNSIKNKMLDNLISKLIYLPIRASLPKKCEYLPASRTGYLQTYKHLASIAITNLSSPDAGDIDMNLDNKLSILTTWFLNQLNNATMYKSTKLSEYIEKTILHGKVNLFENNNNIEFELDNGSKININYLSSTISELIPLVVFIKRGFIVKNGMVVIEEPEAHLSFKNQKLMASLITLLVKENIKVIITTHSDFLIYEFNNLILKHELVNSDKFADIKNIIENSYYDKEDKDNMLNELLRLSNDTISLSYKQIKVYNFILDINNKSKIEELKVDYRGIASEYIKQVTLDTSKEKNLLIDMLELYER